MRSAVLVIPVLAVAALSSTAFAHPTIDVYTMGAGTHPFTRFGHAAICVADAQSPAGRCYNYGTADFDTPGPLTWRFIRGRARFWVSVVPLAPMLRFYQREDRTIWRQTLVLTSTQAAGVRDALAASSTEAKRYYRYHHFLDNCTTRIRDVVDDAVGGALNAATGAPLDHESYRAYARRGFAGDAPLLIAADLLLGRATDSPVSAWAAMFHPDELRRELTARLGVEPVTVYRRKTPLDSGSTALGRAALSIVGVLFGLAALAAGRSRLGGGIIAVHVTLLTLVGGVLWFLAAASDFSELRYNEALLILTPCDGALLMTGLRRRYLELRLASVALVLGLSSAGVLQQPLLAPALWAALPLAAWRYRMR